MNILIGANYQSPYAGNFIASLLTLADRASAQGDRVCFVFPLRPDGDRPWADWLRSGGYEVDMMDLSGSEEEQLSFLSALTVRQETDLLYLHFGFLHRLITQNRTKFRNVKVLLHDHMGFSLDADVKKQIQRNLLRSGYYRVKKIGVISVLAEKDRSYRLLGRKHWLISNGVTLRRYQKLTDSREALRKRFEIDGQARVILMLAWDMQIKGVDVAVQAVRLARKTCPELELAIVIQGDDPSPDCISYISDRTGLDPRQEDWIRFLPSTEDIFAYHRMADAFLSSSRTEAFPYGVLEAIFSELPVIMSDIPGIKWAKGYSRSLIYPVEDAAACAEALLRVPELAARPSNTENYLEPYGIETWCRNILDVIHSL